MPPAPGAAPCRGLRMQADEGPGVASQRLPFAWHSLSAAVPSCHLAASKAATNLGSCSRWGRTGDPGAPRPPPPRPAPQRPPPPAPHPPSRPGPSGAARPPSSEGPRATKDSNKKEVCQDWLLPLIVGTSVVESATSGHGFVNTAQVVAGSSDRSKSRGGGNESPSWVQLPRADCNTVATDRRTALPFSGSSSTEGSKCSYKQENHRRRRSPAGRRPHLHSR